MRYNRPYEAARRLRPLADTALVAIGTGAVGGLAAFVYLHPALAPIGAPWPVLALVAAAGAHVHLLTGGLRRSVGAALGAFFVAVALLLGLSAAPLWLLDYPANARSVLLARFVGRAATGAAFDFALVFLAGYLLTVTVSGYLRS